MRKVALAVLVIAVLVGCSGAGSQDVAPEAASKARENVKRASGPPPGMPGK